MDKVSGLPGNTTPFGLDCHCLAIGFSARALAQALREAGFSVIALDAFGDYDTRESAKVPQIITEWGAADPEKALQGVWPFYRELQNPLETDIFLPVFMAGGCENWPELLSFLRKLPNIRILGPTNDQMIGLRSPELLKACTESTSVGFPTSLFEDLEFEDEKQTSLFPGYASTTWLRKSRSSGGGMGVSPLLLNQNFGDQSTGGDQDAGYTANGAANGDTARAATANGDTAGVEIGAPASQNSGSSPHYLQAFVPGRPLGVTCIVSRDALSYPSITYVGATESWEAADWPGPLPFIYRGSFGPVNLTQSQVESIEQVAMSLVQAVDATGGDNPETRYRGWLQMDLIEDPTSRLWLLEVNPRWTAGMEVLRLSGLSNPVRLHAQAFGLACHNATETSTTGQSESGQTALWVGKAIYYAPHPITLNERLVHTLHQHCSDGFFDLPSAESIGSQIELGHPLLTIVVRLDRQSLTYEQARREALSQLDQKRQMLQEWIAGM